MRSLRSPATCLIFAACLGACGKSKAPPEPAKPASAAVALPAETRTVIGVDVAKVAASPLAVRALRALLDADPDTRARVDSLLARCKIDLAADLKSVTIGMGGPDDVAMVIAGRIDENTLVGCIREAVPVEQRGRTYVATAKDGRIVYFAFGGEPTLILATNAAWLGKIVDPAAAKLGGATAERLAKVGPRAAVWGVGELPAGVGQKLVELAKGEIAAPAQSVAFEVELDGGGGMSASLGADMASAADADKLAVLVKSELGWAAVFAQRWGLGRLVAKADVRTDQRGVRVSLKLDDKELAEVAAVLDGKEHKR
jgi:hypothetical protein